VRSTARLHLPDLHRALGIADVEDADAAEALGADILGDALPPAIDPRRILLDGHDQELADDRHVALAARADHGRGQARLAAGVEPVEVEAVIAAGRHQVAGKGHVGIGEAQLRGALAKARAARRVGTGGRLTLGLGRGPGGRLLGGDLRRQAGRVGGIEESGRLGQARHQPHVADRLARIAIAAVSDVRGSADRLASTTTILLISACCSLITSLTNSARTGS
jgi:hypothetical protein